MSGVAPKGSRAAVLNKSFTEDPTEHNPALPQEEEGIADRMADDVLFDDVYDLFEIIGK